MNKFFIPTFLFVFFSSVLIGQTRLFVDPNFSSIGNSHELIAVVPFKTSISLRPKEMENISNEQLEKMEKEESMNIQSSLYSWFLKRRQQGKMWVDIQDINTTNGILSKNKIDNVNDISPKELASILGVDAVINGSFQTNKPLSDGAGLAIGVLFGYFGATNKATINMFIHNGIDGKVLVNYNKAVSGSIGSSNDQLINTIMRKASRRIPYTNPK